MQTETTWALLMPFHEVSHCFDVPGQDLDMVQHKEATQVLKSKGRNREDAGTQKDMQGIIAPASNWSEWLRSGCMITWQRVKTSK